MVSCDAGGTLKPIFDAQGNLQQFRDIDPDNPGTVDSGSFLIDAGNGYIALVQEMDVSSGLTTIRLLGPDGTLVGSTDSAQLANFDLVTSVTRLEGGNVLIAGEVDGIVMLRLSDGTLQRTPTGIPGVVGPVDFRTMLPIGGATDIKVTSLHPGTAAPNSTGGGFVLAALEPNGATASTLLLETFTAWGARTGSTSINIAISLNGVHPAYDVLALNDGTFVVSWTTKGVNGLDVLAGHFDSNGAALGPSIIVQGDAASGDQTDLSLTLTAGFWWFSPILVPTPSMAALSRSMPSN